ncbi:Hypothetical protein A7982_04664 [Minicystis rosea]|nr:Hypothetical protein A7982_04664 [Minicystis rosea]
MDLVVDLMSLQSVVTLKAEGAFFLCEMPFGFIGLRGTVERPGSSLLCVDQAACIGDIPAELVSHEPNLALLLETCRRECARWVLLDTLKQSSIERLQLALTPPVHLAAIEDDNVRFVIERRQDIETMVLVDQDMPWWWPEEAIYVDEQWSCVQSVGDRPVNMVTSNVLTCCVLVGRGIKNGEVRIGMTHMHGPSWEEHHDDVVTFLEDLCDSDEMLELWVLGGAEPKGYPPGESALVSCSLALSLLNLPDTEMLHGRAKIAGMCLSNKQRPGYTVYALTCRGDELFFAAIHDKSAGATWVSLQKRRGQRQQVPGLRAYRSMR